MNTYKVIGEPTSIHDAEQLAAEDPYQFQWWALGLVGARPTEQKKGADFQLSPPGIQVTRHSHHLERFGSLPRRRQLGRASITCSKLSSTSISLDAR
jgi:hypothetical protein